MILTSQSAHAQFMNMFARMSSTGATHTRPPQAAKASPPRLTKTLVEMVPPNKLPGGKSFTFPLLDCATFPWCAASSYSPGTLALHPSYSPPRLPPRPACFSSLLSALCSCSSSSFLPKANNAAGPAVQHRLELQLPEPGHPVRPV